MKFTITAGQALVAPVEASSPEEAVGAAKDRLLEILAAHVNPEDDGYPSEIWCRNDTTGAEDVFGW